MSDFVPLSLTDQLAAHLRRKIEEGEFRGSTPGAQSLAAEFDVHHSTAAKALNLLEREGILVSQGPGRKRLIRERESNHQHSMRVGILPYEESDRTSGFLLEMQHMLLDAGHSAGFLSRSLTDLGMNHQRVARFTEQSEMDAWVVVAGPREILQWFSEQAAPVFALFGRRRAFRMAGTGPDKLPALRQAVDLLVGLGHRRIVMLLREEHRKPQPGFVATALLAAMEANGLPTGTYNLPDWEDTPEGLRKCLDSLFRLSPPSALLLDESCLFEATQQYLARAGVLAPRDVSLICADPDPDFMWHDPAISHIYWDRRMVGRHVVRWANNVASGRKYIRQNLIRANFVEGGTIGPAR